MPKQTPKYQSWAVIGIVLTLVTLGLVYVIYGQPAAAPSSIDNSSTGTAQTAKESPSQEPTSLGSYVVYSQKALDQTSESSRRVLFFHAGWCPQCRMLEEDINNQGVPSGMTIFKVNYDSAGDLKQKYGVTLQTTFVEIDAQGNLLKKHVAYSQPNLVATLKALGN